LLLEIVRGVHWIVYSSTVDTVLSSIGESKTAFGLRM
jgi:hypothetical protein